MSIPQLIRKKLTCGDNINFLIVLNDSCYGPLSQDHAEVRIPFRFMLNHVLHYLIPGFGVKPQRRIMIQKSKGIPHHVGDLIVQEVIVIAELINDVIWWVLPQKLQELTRRQRDELQVEDFQLLLEWSNRFSLILTQGQIDQHLSFSNESNFEISLNVYNRQ
jgi:hypothetical protein